MGQLKQIKGKMIFKHETAADWELSQYKPEFGEMVLYDPDENHNYTRVKFGDGETIVKDLPFSEQEIDLTPYQLKADAVGRKTAEGGEVFNNHPNNTASGSRSHAEGANTKATGEHAHAEGHSTTASGEDSHAEGRDTKASGTSAHAEGWVTTASGSFSHAEGHTTHAEGDFSHAAGRDTVASGDYSYADGQATRAEGAYSRASGWHASALSEYSFAHGIRAKATAKNAYAFGADTTASGHHSVAFNNETIASGTESMAIGYGTKAEGNHSFASGSETIASGTNAQATGHFTIASGDNSYAGGYGTYGATLTCDSHSSGVLFVRNAESINKGDALVYNFTNIKILATVDSIVHRYDDTEDYEYSEISTTPSTYDLENMSEEICNEVDNNAFTLTVVNATIAAHNNSFAHGVEVKTGRDSQAVFGRYNKVDSDALFIIGNGEGNASRKNAFMVKEDGTAYVGGDKIVKVTDTSNFVTNQSGDPYHETIIIQTNSYADKIRMHNEIELSPSAGMVLMTAPFGQVDGTTYSFNTYSGGRPTMTDDASQKTYEFAIKDEGFFATTAQIDALFA